MANIGGSPDPSFRPLSSGFGPPTVPAGGQFTVQCDYGTQNSCIKVAPTPGFTCSAANPLFNGASTVANFNCTAASGASGSYSVSCNAEDTTACAGGFCSKSSDFLGQVNVSACTINPQFAAMQPPLGNVNQGSPFTATCDFNGGDWTCIQIQNSDTSAPPCSGPSKVPIGSHFAAQFNCTATGAPGPYTLTCLAMANCAGTPFCSPGQGTLIYSITNDPCNAVGTVCGKITAAETNTIPPSVPLKNIPVELRNTNGSISTTYPPQLTDVNGWYSFPTVQGSRYYVSPAVGRTQTAAPLSQLADLTFQLSSAKADFLIRGVPATVNFSGVPAATFILLTNKQLNPVPAQPFTVNGGTNPEAYSTTVREDGTASIKLPSGAYYITCWIPQSDGSYRPTTSQSLLGGTVLVPQKTVPQPVSCPQ